MYRVFVLFLVAALALPAIPVAGCECNQNNSIKQKVVCGKLDSNSTQEKQSCCCKSTQQQNQTKSNGPQCEKKSCDCRQLFSQPATATPIKSIELTLQLRYQFQVVESDSTFSESENSTSLLQIKMSPQAEIHSSRESCAHFCTWLI